MDRQAIVVGKTYLGVDGIDQRKVLDIGRHIRPVATEAIAVPAGDPGLRYEQVEGRHRGLIEDTYLSAFAAWASRPVPEPLEAGVEPPSPDLAPQSPGRRR